MRVTLALVLIVLTAQPVVARDDHHHRQGAEADVGDRRGNNAYGKAKVDERDKLIGKLKNMNICRGCVSLRWGPSCWVKSIAL
jgi:hypothetical protein